MFLPITETLMHTTVGFDAPLFDLQPYQTFKLLTTVFVLEVVPGESYVKVIDDQTLEISRNAEDRSGQRLGSFLKGADFLQITTAREF